MKTTTPSPSASRRRVLFSVCLAALSMPLSFSGGVVATPEIGRDLGGQPVDLNWITNAFMLTFGSLLMAAGSLADHYGRKTVFAYGIAGFVLVSLALACAPTMLSVDLLRGVQGIAAAAALAGGTAALAQEYEGAARQRAFSMLGTTFGIGLAIGPILAGWLVARFGWRAIFVVCALTATLSLTFGVPRMRETRDPHSRRFDLAGTAAFTAALACLTCAVIDAPSHGWTSSLVRGLLCGFVACGTVFVLVETHAVRPMLDLSLFKYPRFVGVQVLPVATCYCYVVLLVLLPLRFIGFDGHDALQAGVTMLALSGPMLAVPFLAVTLTRWMSAGAVCGMGLLVAAAGLYALGIALRGGNVTATLAPMLTIGIGAGLPWGLMDGLSISVVPKARAGMATGIFGTMRVAGEGVAIACVIALLAAFIHAGLRAAAPHATAVVFLAVSTRLANGDLAAASVWIPEVAPTVLRAIYQAAFERLLDVLAVVTLSCALAAFAFLGRRVYHEA